MPRYFMFNADFIFDFIVIDVVICFNALKYVLMQMCTPIHCHCLPNITEISQTPPQVYILIYSLNISQHPVYIVLLNLLNIEIASEYLCYSPLCIYFLKSILLSEIRIFSNWLPSWLIYSMSDSRH